MAKTVIKYAKELVETVGKEKAIEVFENRIKEKGEPKNFEDICKISGWEVAINFNNPKDVQDQLIEITNSVEKECPFAKAFGINGFGEGVVYSSNTVKYGTLRFKVKGEKNSGKTSKKKDIVSVDPIKLKNIDEFVNYAVHENRLEQALDIIFLSREKKINIKKIDNFLKWIVNDILEEEIDVLKKSDLEIKDVSKQISNVARIWFMDKLDKMNNNG